MPLPDRMLDSDLEIGETRSRSGRGVKTLNGREALPVSNSVGENRKNHAPGEFHEESPYFTRNRLENAPF